MAGIGNGGGSDYRCDAWLHFRLQTGFHFQPKCSIDLPKACPAESA
jgi:hypothetical protein